MTMEWLLHTIYLGLFVHVLMVEATSIYTSDTLRSDYAFRVKREAENEHRSASEWRHRHNDDETEFWGYIDVRPGAHMFYWLYHSSHPDGYLRRPLIIWLQGGPGSSGCGYGNFELIGPRGLNFTTRNTSWVHQASVLFVDNPVGSGFSYVNESIGSYATNIDEITDDLVSFFRQFIVRFRQFSKVPIYVFGQSYGGKMAAHFANRLYYEAAAGQISVSVVGFSVGNAWISPGEQTTSYGPLLYQLSLIDDRQLQNVQVVAANVKEQLAAGQYNAAHRSYRMVLFLLHSVMYSSSGRDLDGGVDWYNFLVHHKPDSDPLGALHENAAYLDYFSPLLSTWASNELTAFMNGPVRDTLGIIPPEVTWQTINRGVFYGQADLLGSAVHVVDDSLWNTTLQVIIMEGQLDVICNTAGVMSWVQTLTWPELNNYHSSERQTLRNPDSQITEAFVKAHDRLKFYWILNAGHSVAKDNDEATYRVLERILGNVDV